MSRESNQTLPLGAILSGLLAFSLVGGAAAGPSGPMGSTPGSAGPALFGKSKTAQPGAAIGSDRARQQIPAGAPAKAQTALPKTSAFENLKGTAGTMGRQAALLAGRGGEGL